MNIIRDAVRKWEPFWVEADATVRDAVRELCERKIGAAAVKSGDELAGVFSERDVLVRVINKALDPGKVRVRDVMSTAVNVVHLEDEGRMAKAIMVTHHVRHLIVVDSNNQYCGILSMRDLMEADVRDCQDLIHELNERYYEQKYAEKWRISSNRVIIESYKPEQTPAHR
ncbi:MAG: CBS domain-containing protein [Candidatus Hydrogenedentes bacterium]|nr:CBS domain-containing protein [Candidatus Hydrogenedentota bacterium]